MESSNPEQQVGGQQASNDLHSARRRLIRGSFSVPVALTLASGTAFAAGSAGLRCVNNSATANSQPAPGLSDTLIRVRAYSTGSGNSAYVFVKGEDVAAKLGTSTGTLAVKDRLGVSLSSTTSLCVVGENNSGANRVQANTVINTPASSTATSAYYAILVDENGNIVGISTVSTVAGGAVSNVCWQSFGGLV